MRFPAARLFFFAALLVFFNSGRPAAPPELKIKPETIRLLGIHEIQTFNIEIISDLETQGIGISIEIPDSKTKENISIFARNVKWRQTGDIHTLIDIYGKPAKLYTKDKKVELEITIKSKIDEPIYGTLQIYYRKKIAATAPFSIEPPWGFMKRAGGLFIKYKLYIASIFAAIIFILIITRIVSSVRKRKIQALTKAQFSAMLKHGKYLTIDEKDNPFHVRLSGFSKKVKVNYVNSTVQIRIGASTKKFNDTEKIELKINKYWQLSVVPHNYSTLQGLQKALTVMIYPVS